MFQRTFSRIVRRNFSSSSVGQVYSFGRGDEGQLGLPNIVKSGITSSYSELSPVKLPFFSESLRAKDISMGHSHAAAISSKGELFTWGSSEFGKLGHNVLTNDKLCLLPSKVSFDNDNNVDEICVQVDCGEFNSAVVTENGNLYTFGYNGSAWQTGALGLKDSGNIISPQKVDFGSDEIKIKQVSCGKNHTVCVDDAGIVWSCGRGEFGRNGNGGNDDQKEFEPIDYFLELDINIVQVSCGSNFTMALSDEGKLFGWGSNDHCQLGLGSGFAVDMFAMENFPKQIESPLENEKIVQVATGTHHSVALTQDGKVYLWGMKMWMEPHLMTALSDQNIKFVSCGHNFSIAGNDVGELFSWGKGFVVKSGCLGLGHTKRTIQPEIISAFQGKESIQKVSCGNKSVLALSGIPSL